MSKKRTRTSTIQVDPEADKNLRCHLQALGLKNDQEYKAWCRQHGFSGRLYKDWRQQQRERLLASREIAAARLAESRKKAKSPETIVDAFTGRLPLVVAHSPLLPAIRRVGEAAGRDRNVKEKLLALLLHVQHRTDFLNAGPALSQFGHQSGNTWIDGLLALAHHWRLWLRPVEAWCPRTHNTRRQFASLARHLLAEYPVPVFMDAVWFLGTGEAVFRRQRWFSHIGLGSNIRTADTPIPLTKRMAHYFMQAPADCTVDQAVRWGQVLGLGGDPRLAQAIIASRLGEHFEHDEFWVTVIRFFIDSPMLDPLHVGPIIDYLYDQRFRDREEFVAAGVFERRPPAQPNLSMKGRSPTTLLRQVERWHRQLGKEAAHIKGEWVSSGIVGYDGIEGTKGSPSLRRWTIRELLSGSALVAEGHAMHHCVASYAHSCSRRVTSIWSLQMHNHEGSQRVLTVEVRLASKTICQARGKRNVMPDAKAKDILRRWAAQEGLTLTGYI
jgi:hypothetical protein